VRDSILIWKGVAAPLPTPLLSSLETAKLHFQFLKNSLHASSETVFHPSRHCALSFTK